MRANELVYLLDENGKRHFLRVGQGMAKVPGLGVIDSSRLLDVEEGGRIELAGTGFVVLGPKAPELMESLDRGAQVIMPKDAATIVFQLGIEAGETVIEAGVGSGSLTTALLFAVGPNGKVVSIEIREDHASKASRNIERTGLADRWRLVVADAKTAKIGETADCLVMDLPAPWEALENLGSRLRSGGRVCAYVPNMNQVEQTVKALRANGYVEAEALENLQRGIEVHEGGVRPSFDMLGHTGYLIFARKTLAATAKE
ncbi:MAG TPA: tRNA (adenine-N1)-methyltransferase [Methanomassiliicoccales archaeon]|nr:tRNA (adenine-N1)-methyltransferase [Methanomassiliicoccales archaeon]